MTSREAQQLIHPAYHPCIVVLNAAERGTWSEAVMLMRMVKQNGEVSDVG